MRCIPALLMIALAIGNLYAGGEPKAGSVSAGRFWQLEVWPKSEGAQVVALWKENRTRVRTLCETPSVKTTRVFLSPTDDPAIIESGSASLGTSLRVFWITDEGEFVNTPRDEKITDVLQAAWEKATGKRAEKPSAHFVKWTDDPTKIIVSWGIGDPAWKAVLDLWKHECTPYVETSAVKKKRKR